MKKLSVIGLVVAFLALFAGPVVAQDGPAMTVEPSSVEAAGTYDFTVSGEGFTAGNSIFILPCAGAEGDLQVLADGDSSALCDLASLTPVSIGDDGTFTVEVTGYEVPDVGLAIGGGDAGGVDAASALVTVGDGGGDEAADEEEPAEEEEATEEESDLAETGAETGILVGAGAALLGLGFVATRAGRRLGDR